MIKKVLAIAAVTVAVGACGSAAETASTSAAATGRAEDSPPFAERTVSTVPETTAPPTTMPPPTTAPTTMAALVATVPPTTRATAPPTTRATAPPPTQAAAVVPAATVYFANCTAARDAGAAPVHRGDPGYASHLDRDNDGIGCEN